jgi:hypothetical protein
MEANPSEKPLVYPWLVLEAGKVVYTERSEPIYARENATERLRRWKLTGQD